MNNSTYHNQKPSQRKHTSKRLTEEQVRLLESSFDSSKKLEPELKHQLSRQLGLPPRQIAIWYQNKRARWKNQSLEHDYNMLQIQLEATLFETRQLQKEVDKLRAELNKVKVEQARYHKYYTNNNNNNNNNNNHKLLMDTSFSICGDQEGGSSSRSLEDDMNNIYCFGQQAFQVEEMYAMGSDLGLFAQQKKLF